MVTLIRELYRLRQAGQLTDTEAAWVLRVVYGEDGVARIRQTLECSAVMK